MQTKTERGDGESSSADMEPAARREAPAGGAVVDDRRRDAVVQRRLGKLANEGARMDRQRLAAQAIQRKAGDQAASPNRTGLPDRLKAGIESLSGMRMDGVRVHYNSARPAQLNAHAYAQGTDIHIAPGQEKHLPHEAWHVVQQQRGHVHETTRVAGASVNDDAALERDADVMGAQALQMQREDMGTPLRPASATAPAGRVIQKFSHVAYDGMQALNFDAPATPVVGAMGYRAHFGSHVLGVLDRYHPITGSGVGGGGAQGQAIADINAKHPGQGWVLGHLLNGNLGGLGLSSNLAPITAEANQEHSWAVERQIKRLVYTQPATHLALQDDGYVEYEVHAAPTGAFTSATPNLDFQCRWRTQIPDPLNAAPAHPYGWTGWQQFNVESRSGGVLPALAGGLAGWAQVGTGLYRMIAPNVSAWSLGYPMGGGPQVASAAFAANPGGLPLPGMQPGNAVFVIVEAAGTAMAKVLGWQF